MFPHSKLRCLGVALLIFTPLLLIASCSGGYQRASLEESGEGTPPVTLLDATVQAGESLSGLDQLTFEFYWDLYDRINPPKQNITPEELTPELRPVLALADESYRLQQEVKALNANLERISVRLNAIIDHPDKGTALSEMARLHAAGGDLITEPHEATFGGIDQAIARAREFEVEADPALIQSLDQSRDNMANLVHLLG